MADSDNEDSCCVIFAPPKLVTPTLHIAEEKANGFGIRFEIAKSSRSTCRGCNTSIEAGKVRFGRESFAQYGTKMQWYHPECALTLKIAEDNRSKCKICHEKIFRGEIRVFAGCDKGTATTRFHYNCFYDKVVPISHQFHDELQNIISQKKINLETMKEDEVQVDSTTLPSESVQAVAVKKEEELEESSNDIPEAKKRKISSTSSAEMSENSSETDSHVVEDENVES